jgi:hypothetical protein
MVGKARQRADGLAWSRVQQSPAADESGQVADEPIADRRGCSGADGDTNRVSSVPSRRGVCWLIE